MNTIALKRVLLMSLKSFFRNSWLSLTGTLVMIITLLIISFFFILSISVNKTADSLKEKIDIVVYFKDSTSDDQIKEIERLLLSRPDVKEVNFVSKEAAKARFEDMGGLDEDLSDVFTDDENPLPRSLEVKPIEAESIEVLNSYLDGTSFNPLIKKISYKDNKATIDRLIKITRFFTQAGLIMSGIFIIISFFIIFNTIKLTIFSRKDEIEIMRLVGATDIFVKFPFIVEGMFYGVLATIIAGMVTYSGYRLVVPAINNYLEGIDVGLGQLIGSNLFLIIIGQLLVGIILGSVCSWWATRRYVK